MCHITSTLPPLKKLSKLVKNTNLNSENNNNEIEYNQPEADATKLALSNFRISKKTSKLLNSRGINALFPIQQATFDYVFDSCDVIGRARTGTGKTLAFALPVVERLVLINAFTFVNGRASSVLCLLPTRELAQQVAKEFDLLCGERYTTICLYGGTPELPQIQALKKGIDIVVGTPGRTIDMLERKSLNLSQLKVVVLDEADQMLEMGFRENVDYILDNVKLSHESDDSIQYLLFSATLPSWIFAIASKFMEQSRKKIVDVVKNEVIKTTSGIKHLIVQCPFGVRAKTLGDFISTHCGINGRCIVFTETKQQANDIAVNSSIGHLCQVLHGDIPQTQREITLKGFRDGRFKCLVATDVAARGLHVDNIELVVQLDPPRDVDTYIHRSGRTGRAGNSGTCITFFKYTDVSFLKVIEKKGNFKFQRIGVPQLDQVVGLTAQTIVDSLIQDTVSDSIMRKLEPAAQLLIGHFGGVEAVCRCLYSLSGNKSNSSDNENRSALTGRENYKTFQILFSDMKVERPALIWKALKTEFPSNYGLIERFATMTIRADGKGAVFDVLLEDLPEIYEIINNITSKGRAVISEVSELPELYDSNMESMDSDKMDSRNPNHRWTSMKGERNFNRGGGNGGGFGGNNFNKNFNGGNKRPRNY